MIDGPQHNLDGSSDAEPPPYQPEPSPPPYQPEPLAEALPPGQTFDHPPRTSEYELPPQDLQSPSQEAPAPEQTPYVSPFGQMPPPMGQLPPAAPAGGGTSYGMPHAWPATPPVQAPHPMTQAVRSEFPLRTVLLIAVPLCIIGVIIAIMLFNNANEEVPPPTTPVATAPPVRAPLATPAATTFGQGSGNGTLRPGGTANMGTSSTPTPPAAPITLSGGGSGTQAAAGSVTNSGLAGRWVSKQADYYQFNADGSGSSGVTSQGKPAQTFNWSVPDHSHITLFPQQGGDSQQQTLQFSFGSNTNSVFLKQPDGRYREYALVKNTDVGG